MQRKYLRYQNKNQQRRRTTTSSKQYKKKKKKDEKQQTLRKRVHLGDKYCGLSANVVRLSVVLLV